jgi:hypothetical protein
VRFPPNHILQSSSIKNKEESYMSKYCRSLMFIMYLSFQLHLKPFLQCKMYAKYLAMMIMLNIISSSCHLSDYLIMYECSSTKNFYFRYWKIGMYNFEADTYVLNTGIYDTISNACKHTQYLICYSNIKCWDLRF